MGDPRVLVAFANQAGSTAGIATAIASVLRRSGFSVDCRLASEVLDVTPYDGVILGSGVFVPRRRSDGGGFLVRHEAALASRSIWLFCAGPIGRGRCRVGTAVAEADDCSVVAVGEAVGARGVAVFGPVGLPTDADPLDSLGPVSTQRVRAWAAEIGEQLRTRPTRPDGPTTRPTVRRCGHVAAAS